MLVGVGVGRGVGSNDGARLGNAVGLEEGFVVGRGDGCVEMVGESVGNSPKPPVSTTSMKDPFVGSRSAER